MEPAPHNKSSVSLTPSRMTSFTPSYTNATIRERDYQTKEGNDEVRVLTVKYEASRRVVDRVFRVRMDELEKYARKWYMETLLPMFMSGLMSTFTNLNLILREYYDRRVRESDLFFKLEGNIGKNPVSIDQLLTFYETYQRHGSLLWVPENPDKFNREHRDKFFSLLSDLELYEKILLIKSKANKPSKQPTIGTILDRLNVINKSKQIAQ